MQNSDDILADVIAKKFFQKFVEDIPDSAISEWNNAQYDVNEDKDYMSIAVWVRSLSSEDQNLLKTLITRICSDSMYTLGSVFCGQYSFGYIEGEEGVFKLLYNDKDIGEEFGFRLQELTSAD
jgi:hypothetical protein